MNIACREAGYLARVWGAQAGGFWDCRTSKQTLDLFSMVSIESSLLAIALPSRDISKRQIGRFER